DYNAVIHANDTLGHERTKTGYFDVFPTVRFTQDVGTFVEQRYRFQRPGTNITLTSVFADGSDINTSSRVRNRTYDVQATFTVPVNNSEGEFAQQSHTVEFNGLDVTGKLQDPIELNIVGVANSTNYPVPNRTVGNKTAAALSLSTNASFTSADITLNYSRVSDYAFVTVANFQLFRCQYTDVQRCSRDDWERINATINERRKTVSAAGLSTFSTYIVVNREAKQTKNQTQQQEEESQDQQQQQQGSTGPTGGGLTGPQQGEQNNTGRMERNKTEEVVVPFTVETSFDNPVFERGTNNTELIRTTNNKNSSITVRYNVSGEISRFIRFGEHNATIPPSGTSISTIRVSIPFDTATKSYTGTINVSSGNYSVSLPIAVVVSRGEAQGFEFALESVSNTVAPTGTVRVKEFFREIQIDTPFNVTIQYFVRRTSDNLIVGKENVTREITGPISFTNGIELGGLEPGPYYVQAVVQHQGQTITRVATFRVISPFWTATRIRFALFFIITLVTSIAVWRIYRWYRQRKEEEARYVFPVDYNKLP
ncbi:MAG: hypothetical protein SVU32_08070, partial [Candidatus Nanohaloarchaea archaeon]|nr:hypothetical protein [Candidatus Nanohaloarchaea archaeon]